MTEIELLARITVNPKIFGGKPIIRGRRLAVEHVLGLLAQAIRLKRFSRPTPISRKKIFRRPLCLRADWWVESVSSRLSTLHEVVAGFVRVARSGGRIGGTWS